MSELGRVAERIAVKDFLKYKNFYLAGKISYPNPPDCLFEKGGHKGWVEVTSAFKEFDGYARMGQKPFGEYRYEPISHEAMLNEMANSIFQAIEKKDCKEGYSNFNKYGFGILLIYINNPFFCWGRDLSKLMALHNFRAIQLSTFSAVYLFNNPMAQSRVDFRYIRSGLTIRGEDKFHLLCGEDFPRYISE